MANCGVNLGTTGVSPCPFDMKILRRLILVPKYDSTGALNKFSSIDEVTKTNIQEKLDEMDELDRFYALPLMENVDQPRAETTFFEYNSGTKARVKQGTRTFTGWIPDGDPQFLARLQSWYGTEFGFYGIDKKGNFIYAMNAADPMDTSVYPIPIDGNSWDVNMVTATDSDPFYIMLQFDYQADFNDANIRIAASTTVGFDGRTGDLYGLMALEIGGPANTAGTTTIVFVVTDYDTPVSGLVLADFTVYNVTSATDLNVSAVVEDPNNPGQYTLTSDATTAADTIRVTVQKVKYSSASYEFIPS